MKSTFLLLTVLMGTVVLPETALGSAIYRVSVDTSSLVGNPAGPFTIALQLTDGSGTGDGNNSVTLDEFNFGAGGPVGIPATTGGVTGDLASSVTLTDTDFFNDFLQGFTPGNVLSFRVSFTLNPNLIDVPDQFSFAILDGNLIGDPLLAADLDPVNFALLTFGSEALSIPAPTIIPEPSTGWLAFGACCVAVVYRGRTRSRDVNS